MSREINSGATKLFPYGINTIKGTNAEMLALLPANLYVGLVFYNEENNTYYTWNGNEWNGLNNDGKVKINGSGGVQPSLVLVANTPQVLDYGAAALDLSPSPITEFPQNILLPTDSDVWNDTDNTLIENPILGQTHNWRVIFDYSGKNLNDVASIDIRLVNPISGFATDDVIVTAEGRTADTDLQAYLTTIADSNSLPAPLGTGKGYELYFESNKALTITVKSVTRISDMHSSR